MKVTLNEIKWVMEQTMIELGHHQYVIHPAHYSDDEPTPTDYLIKTDNTKQKPNSKFFSHILALEFRLRSVNKETTGEAFVRSVLEKYFDKDRIKIRPHNFYYGVEIYEPLCPTLKTVLRNKKINDFLKSNSD